jgi:hypothetical protein
MARREKTFKKPSYRVNKRILERYIRSKCDLLELTPILFPVRNSRILITTNIDIYKILIEKRGSYGIEPRNAKFRSKSEIGLTDIGVSQKLTP